MGRGGQPKDQQNGPERKCLATGEVRPKADLIRFVASPDGQVVPDLANKLPGRGFYTLSTREALETAVTKKLFARGAKLAVTVPDGLVDLVDTHLTKRVVDMVSLARKSGAAIAGYEKVKSWLDQERASVLIQAVDGSGRGKSKLSTPHFGTYIGWLSADELGMAFGRQTVIHCALASGGLSKRVVEEAKRLKGFRPASDGGKGRQEGKLAL